MQRLVRSSPFLQRIIGPTNDALACQRLLHATNHYMETNYTMSGMVRTIANDNKQYDKIIGAFRTRRFYTGCLTAIPASIVSELYNKMTGPAFDVHTADWSIIAVAASTTAGWMIMTCFGLSAIIAHSRQISLLKTIREPKVNSDLFKELGISAELGDLPIPSTESTLPKKSTPKDSDVSSNKREITPKATDLPNNNADS